MTALIGTHAFTLYRSGYSPSEIPDNQLWANVDYVMVPDVRATYQFDLYPRYGSVASLYRVRLLPADPAPEDHWVSFKAQLQIDGYNLGVLPLSWYVGEPADWPSGLARYPEGEGIRTPANLWDKPSYRGVWSLAARRNS